MSEVGPQPVWREFARAPLVPVAAAASLGLVLDRYLGVPLSAGLFVAAGGLLAFVLTRRRKTAPLWLALAGVGLAAVHHHTYRHSFAADDIGFVAPENPTPVRLRGILLDEPAVYRPTPDPLSSEHRPTTTLTTLGVTAVESPDGWVTASGRVRLTVEGLLDEFHTGDAVQLTGRLAKPSPAANPGERDLRESLLDRRITATVHVARSAAAVTRLTDGWRSSLMGWLGVLRARCFATLRAALPSEDLGTAAALLLGDGAALDRTEWDAYIRAGVVHVLVISGLHFGVLATFVWFVLKLCGLRRRRAAGIVAVLMIAYALLTGARPSAVRATVMVCVVCAAVVARRPAMPANTFALAWLVVVAVNPTDPFTPGCQLSFLSVFVLVWGAGRWLAPRPPTPAEQLIEDSRTPSARLFRRAVRAVGAAYAVSLILGVANAPLVLAWQNLVSPVGVLLTPPLVLLTSVVLVTGFLLILVTPLLGFLAAPLGWLTAAALAGCRSLVHAAELLPGGWVYTPVPATGWFVGFYLLAAATVLLAAVWAQRAALLLAVWVFCGVALSQAPLAPGETRITFLAVGHGCSVVIETSDGRVLLYDAGTSTGPDVVRRSIAPFLWQRGVTRIDEVFLSHGDLDHFNGVPELLKRFPVGRVTLTPTFAHKTTPGVEAMLAALERHDVPRRVAVAGERLDAGGVTLDVLHPPAEGPGPAENENVRSLVLLLRCGPYTVLLTGDLEGEGQAVLRERAVPAVDVMLAPHHGAKAANLAGTQSLAEWARPRFVVSSQRAGPTDHLRAAYGRVGATVWDTATAGAVTVRCHAGGVTAEAYRTGQVQVVVGPRHTSPSG